MKVMCMGKKSGSFTDDTGRTIQYAKVFGVYDLNVGADVQSEGQCCGAISIPFDLYDGVPVGVELDMQFDFNGKCIGITY